MQYYLSVVLLYLCVSDFYSISFILIELPFHSKRKTCFVSFCAITLLGRNLINTIQEFILQIHTLLFLSSAWTSAPVTMPWLDT